MFGNFAKEENTLHTQRQSTTQIKGHNPLIPQLKSKQPSNSFGIEDALSAASLGSSFLGSMLGYGGKSRKLDNLRFDSIQEANLNFQKERLDTLTSTILQGLNPNQPGVQEVLKNLRDTTDNTIRRIEERYTSEHRALNESTFFGAFINIVGLLLAL